MAAKKASSPKKSKPKQIDLIEDREFKDLSEAAMEYVLHRDERMEALKQEVELKGKVLGLMKKHGKKTYIHDNISIEIVPKEEKIKVQVKKPDDDGTRVDLSVLDKE